MADFALLELEDIIEGPLTNYICLGHRNIVRKDDQIRLTGYGWGSIREFLRSFSDFKSNFKESHVDFD